MPFRTSQDSYSAIVYSTAFAQRTALTAHEWRNTPTNSPFHQRQRALWHNLPSQTDVQQNHAKKNYMLLDCLLHARECRVRASYYSKCTRGGSVTLAAVITLWMLCVETSVCLLAVPSSTGFSSTQTQHSLQQPHTQKKSNTINGKNIANTTTKQTRAYVLGD